MRGNGYSHKKRVWAMDSSRELLLPITEREDLWRAAIQSVENYAEEVECGRNVQRFPIEKHLAGERGAV